MRGSRRPSSFLRATQALRASWTRWLQTRLQRKLARVEKRRELLLLEADHLQVRQEELRLRMLPLELRTLRLQEMARSPLLQIPPPQDLVTPQVMPLVERVLAEQQVLFPTPEPEPEEQPLPASQQVWEALKHPS